MTERVAPHVVATGLSAGYSQVPVVRGVSLQVGLGEIVVVVGPNGAGKSTLVKAVTGELELLEGQIRLGDREITGLGEDERMALGMGYVPQLRDVFPTLTVMENLEMGGYRLAKREVPHRVEAVLETFPALKGLRRRLARSMSGGEQKMLGIARALMADPKFLILDEPTANLAPQVATHVLKDIVAQLALAGRAVLLIEQRVALALEIASWGYVLTDGQLRLDRSAPELLAMSDLGTLFLGMSEAGATSVHHH
ncbi:MAG: ABC transporter ATP-binding protein [Candidatus Dormibacteraeota bacterium]|nr:ABC transporter ATP-binding protein [Candidatus Dormibacteraeota bacterium]